MSQNDSPGTLDLLRRSVDDGGKLIQQEIQLAKQELAESVRSVVRGVLAGIVVVIALLGFLVMGIVTIVVATDPHWVAALIFTAVFLAVALGLGAFALRTFKRMSPLGKTRESIQEDIRWAKRQLKPGSK
ncbi:MAG: phage holin family protein [Candidatus Dormibacteria bacterium]